MFRVAWVMVGLCGVAHVSASDIQMPVPSVAASITIEGESADSTDGAMPSNNALSLIFVNGGDQVVHFVIAPEGGGGAIDNTVIIGQ